MIGRREQIVGIAAQGIGVELEVGRECVSAEEVPDEAGAMQALRK